jgi:Tol biopolymer transport system component
MHRDWLPAENLGTPVNSTGPDFTPDISINGKSLLFSSIRAGGMGGSDIYEATRQSHNHPWDQVVNLGSTVNSISNDAGPTRNADRSIMMFNSNRAGTVGNFDIYESRVCWLSR